MALQHQAFPAAAVAAAAAAAAGLVAAEASADFGPAAEVAAEIEVACVGLQMAAGG